MVSMTRREVRTYRGGKVKAIHKGLIISIRMNKVVSAGLVVADVAVRWVERKSVSCMKGSSNILHLDVNVFKVSTISSKLFWCFKVVSDRSFVESLNFSFVHPLEDSGEYRLEYIPNITKTTASIGPQYLIRNSPYRVTVQKAATRRKLSQGSPLVQVINPTTWLSGRRKGWENASARVIIGGVATSKGDLRFTSIVDRCLVAGEELEELGEKAAIVGGFGSPLAFPDPSGSRPGIEAMSVIQGVSGPLISYDQIL